MSSSQISTALQNAAASHDIWKNNIEEELAYWRTILSGTHPMKDWCDSARYVLTQAVPMSYGGFAPMGDYIDIFPEKIIDIVNVGSGPCVPLAVTHPTRFVRMINVDPLGEYYSKMIEEAGYPQHTHIFPFPAETLDKDLPHNHFHIVWSRNALDHSWDPMTGIRNMVKIARPGGKIIIKVAIDEAVRANYGGLHRWNFRPTAAGECELWNPDRLFNVNQEVKDEISDIAVTTLPNNFMLIIMTNR